MATVELEYSIPPYTHNLVSLATKVQGIPLFRGELDHLGMVMSTDVTAVDGSEVKRTITLETTEAGDEMWPTAAALAYATKGLYKQTLALRLPGEVVAADPVVTL